MAEPTRFYVSWIAHRYDPWIGWRNHIEETPSGKRFFCNQPEADAEWPGVPFRQTEAGWRTVETGPTLAALFHPKSFFCNLADIDRVYLLYDEDIDDKDKVSKHDQATMFLELIQRIIRARKLRFKPDVIRLVPIQGITNPADHAQVFEGVKAWIDSGQDPFYRPSKDAKTFPERKITINLSPGTPAAHACWLMLRWSGVLGHDWQRETVVFVHGDGGPDASRVSADDQRQPVRHVPFLELTRFTPALLEAPPADDIAEINLTDLKCPALQEVAAKLDNAAALRVPTLLLGARGIGKTFLARYYHDQSKRTFPKLSRKDASSQKKASGAGRNDAQAVEIREPKESGRFVKITVSEFSQADDLRDELFGWLRGAFTGAADEYEGQLGLAHNGTLFLDEIHHLEPPLQAMLLGVMNDKRYRQKAAIHNIRSDFGLVLASNQMVDWHKKMMPDFMDRIRYLILKVPSFKELASDKANAAAWKDDLWTIWLNVLQRRCQESRVRYAEMPEDCRAYLQMIFELHEFPGNWRDLQRLAVHALLNVTDARAGRPTALTWTVDNLKRALQCAFGAS